MTVGRKLQLAIALLVLMVIGNATTIFYSYRAVTHAIKDNRGVDDVIRGIFELSLLSHEYQSRREPRVVLQWRAAYHRLGSNLARLRLHNSASVEVMSDEGRAVRRINNNYEIIGSLLDKLLPTSEQDESEFSEEAVRIINQGLLLRSSVMLADAHKLVAASNNTIVGERRKELAILVGSLSMVALVGIFIFFANRRILGSLLVLGAATDRIAKGDFSTVIPLGGHDEFTALGEATNAMASRLQSHYAELSEANWALAKAEERFRSAFQHAAIGKALVSLDGRCLQANRALCTLFHYTEKEFVGLAFDELTHPHDRALDAEEMRELLGGDKDAFQMEKRYLARSGTIIWTQLSVSMLHDERGRPLQFILQIQDITDRKQAETALRESAREIEDLYNKAPCGYHSVNASGTFVRMNDTELQWLGYSRDEVIGKVQAFDIMTPESRQLFHDTFADFKERGFISNLAFELMRKDGSVLPVVLGATAVFDHNGQFLMSRSTLFDNTERRAAEQALLAQSRELARSNAELEQFAYVASHDLREPLRMVNSYVTLLERRYTDRLDDDGREFMAFAKDGAKRMDRLILDLLDYSRIGRAEQRMAPVDLNAVLKDALLNLRAALDETQAAIDIVDTLPMLMGSRAELARLFQNLVGNAIKYRDPERKPVVTVRAGRQGDSWVITFKDNGIGIAPEYFDRIFGIFQRLHGRGEYEGTGIGLAVCKKIVEHHGGRIWLDSMPGQGTAFHIALPAEGE